MRTEELFVVEGTGKDAFSEMARVVESITKGTPLPDGRNLKESLSEEDKQMARNYVMGKLQPIIEKTVRAVGAKMELSYDDEEEFRQILSITVFNQLPLFNRDEYVEKTDETYEIASFIKKWIPSVLREIEAFNKHMPVNAIRNQKKIENTIFEISVSNRISEDKVSAEMIYEALDDDTIMLETIAALLRVRRGIKYLDEDADDKTASTLEDEKQNVERSVLQKITPEKKAALDAILAGLSDMELFLLLRKMEMLGDNLKGLTVKQLSYQDFFVELARNDKNGKKHIAFGNVEIVRPGRNTKSEEAITIEDVYYVEEDFIKNVMPRIQNKLLGLASVFSSSEEIVGVFELYCLHVWNKRMNK